ncbi:MAG: hypothetical protein ACFE9L_09010 [Candidatus Hodarchaeota archaeon]
MSPKKTQLKTDGIYPDYLEPFINPTKRLTGIYKDDINQALDYIEKKKYQEALVVIKHAILKEIRIMCVHETDELFWYDKYDGYWKDEANKLIKIMARRASSTLTRNQLEELVNKFKTEKNIRVSKSSLNPRRYLCVKGSVLDLKQILEISSSTNLAQVKIMKIAAKPEFYHTKRLNVSYNPKAVPQKWEKFMTEVTNIEGKRIIEETIGLIIYPGYPIHAIVIFYGLSHAGKETTLKVIKIL